VLSLQTKGSSGTHQIYAQAGIHSALRAYAFFLLTDGIEWLRRWSTKNLLAPPLATAIVLPFVGVSLLHFGIIFQ